MVEIGFGFVGWSLGSPRHKIDFLMVSQKGLNFYEQTRCLLIALEFDIVFCPLVLDQLPR